MHLLPLERMQRRIRRIITSIILLIVKLAAVKMALVMNIPVINHTVVLSVECTALRQEHRFHLHI